MPLNILMKIKCMTLFDITKTGVSNRRHNLTNSAEDHKKRNQQSNFETLLQIISLRCQPENISDPVVTETSKNVWGTSYKAKKVRTWSFTFTVDVASIYKFDGDDIGHLKSDCMGVPMILGLDESPGLEPILSYNRETKNIHFEIEHEE